MSSEMRSRASKPWQQYSARWTLGTVELMHDRDNPQRGYESGSTVEESITFLLDKVDRLLALVKELSEMGCEDEEFIGNDPRSHELHDEKNWKKCGECLSCRARSELEGTG